MINLKVFMNSIKATWIRRLVYNNKLQDIIKSFDINFEELLETGIENIKKHTKKCVNPFWTDVLNVWIDILNAKENLYWEDFLMSPIWYNKNVRIGGRCVFYKEWFKKGVKIINDLVDETGTFLSLEKLQKRFSIQTNYLTYYGLTQCLNNLSEKHKKSVNDPPKIIYPYKPQNISIFLKNKKGSKDFYKVLMNVHSACSEPTNKDKLVHLFQFNESDIKNIYNLPFKVNGNSQLQWFQYKINHLVLTTNSFLAKIKIKTNPFCTLCGKQPETITHLLWECEKVQLLLENFEKWQMEMIHFPLNYKKKSFMFGILNSKNSKVHNLIILKIKHYIYTCRCLEKPLSLQGLQNSIINLYQTEKYAALLAQNIDIFNKEWNIWHTLFKTD